MTETNATNTDAGVDLLQMLHQQMQSVQANHPDWYADYEDGDVFTASREVLSELVNTAPTDFARGLLVGVMMFRQQLAIITGRSF